jgi:hypothetical protein
MTHLASSLAAARPMPLPPPVITATRPALITGWLSSSIVLHGPPAHRSHQQICATSTARSRRLRHDIRPERGSAAVQAWPQRGWTTTTVTDHGGEHTEVLKENKERRRIREEKSSWDGGVDQGSLIAHRELKTSWYHQNVDTHSARALRETLRKTRASVTYILQHSKKIFLGCKRVRVTVYNQNGLVLGRH